MNEISVETATQLSKILAYLPDNMKKKIPNEILKKISNKTDSTINTRINDVIDVREENILPETRKYLSFIFINYLATEEEKEEYTKIIKNNEERYQQFLSKKYDVEKIFNKRKEHSINETQECSDEKNRLPIERKENFFQFILNKIKGLLKKCYRGNK